MIELEGLLNDPKVEQLWKSRNKIFPETEVNLQKISSVNSAGVAFLVLWAEDLKAKNKSPLVLHHLPTEAGQLIRLFKVEPLFTFRSD